MNCFNFNRYMATGESLRSLGFAFRISQSYITRIIQLVLKSLSSRLPGILLKPPSREDLIQIARDFWEKWNFPNCVGSIDGKHIRIFCPGKSGSLFFNYKDFFSIVLLAIVDANCKFIYVDIGSYGKEGDSGIFSRSSLYKLIKQGNYFPPNENLPTSSQTLPYVHVGDEAFHLETHMMRPYTRGEARKDYEKTIFNYRLSRARRTAENSFGLLSQIFRVFYSPIALKSETTDHLVLTACCLHNLLRNRYIENTSKYYYNFDQNETEPTQNMMALVRSGGYANFEGFLVRDEFKKFFNSEEGAVPWQDHQTQKKDN